MLDPKEIKKTIKNNIKKYVDENTHLFKSDSAYVINCQLKPRLAANAVETSCQERRNCGPDKKINSADCYKNFFIFAITFAAKYINEKDKGEYLEEEKYTSHQPSPK